MIDAVIGYALINILFELTLLALCPPRPRLRLLGSKHGTIAIHIVMFSFTLWVHWGTLLGTTGAFAAFPASIVAMFAAKQFFGYIQDGNYHRRVIGYTAEELKEKTA